MEKKAQVWIETVLYTLIGLALIGITLAFITPKITDAKDKALIEQTVESLGLLDKQITTVIDTGQGNSRIVDITLKRGRLYVDGEQDKVYIVLEGIEKPYSEVGVDVELNSVLLRTERDNDKYKVIVSLEYGGTVNILYSGKDANVDFPEAAVSYKFSVLNLGFSNGKININIEERS